MEEKARLKLKENDLTQPESGDEKNDIPIEPFKTNCEYCSKKVTTCVKKEYNLLIFPYIIIILYIYGFFYGIIILALTSLLFQNITHMCPECLCEITYKSFYPIKKQGPYYSLTFGKCTIVLKKVYIHILILLLLLFGLYLNIMYYKYNKKNNNIDEYERNNEKYIKTFYEDNEILTWENLIKECGAKVMIENSVRALEIFNKKYLKKIIQWKGYFINAFVNRASQIGMDSPNHLVNINIRMIPSETIKAQDLLLSMGKETFLKHFDLIKNINTGTPVEFKAEFESVGDEWKPHHLHLIWINSTDDFMKDKVNVTLFRGVNFDIQGHLKHKDEIDKISGEINKNNTTINENNTNINEKEKEK